MTQSLRLIKPMNVVWLLFGLIVDMRWGNFMRLFSDASWYSIIWWFIGIFAFLFVFTLASLVFLVIVEQLISGFRKLGSVRYTGMWGAVDGAEWYYLGAVVHYLTTLAVWHDAESLLLAWLHLICIPMHLLHQKTKQLIRSRHGA